MNDVNSRYTVAFDDPTKTIERTIELLQGHKILFVRGFLSEAILKIGEALSVLPKDQISASPVGTAIAWVRDRMGAPAPRHLGEYFDTQTSWLGDNGISFECAEIESENPIDENAEKVGRYFTGSKPIIIISHSKGCLDTLQALLRAPGVWPQIDGWIAVQGPFDGAPVADFVAERPPLRAVAKAALEAVGGKLEGLTDMCTPAMRSRLRANSGSIAKLTRTVPTLCMATSLSPARIMDTFLGAPLLLTHLISGKDNDGLVPAASASLPDASTITLDGIDHAMPVMDSIGRFDRGLCTQALLCVLEDLRSEMRQ